MDELSLLIRFLQSAKSYAGKRKVAREHEVSIHHAWILVEAIVAYWDFAITE